MCEFRNHFFHLINNKINNYRVCSQISHTFSALITLADSHFRSLFAPIFLQIEPIRTFHLAVCKFPGSQLHTLAVGRALRTFSSREKPSRRTTQLGCLASYKRQHNSYFWLYFNCFRGLNIAEKKHIRQPYSYIFLDILI